jgi:hypothetical protein
MRVVATIRDPHNRSVATIEAAERVGRLLLNVKQTKEPWQKLLAPLKRARIDLALDGELHLVRRRAGDEQVSLLAADVVQRSKGKLRVVRNPKALQQSWLAELHRAYEAPEQYVPFKVLLRGIGLGHSTARESSNG